jgi:hypothetical protein
MFGVKREREREREREWTDKNYVSKMPRNKNSFEDNIKVDFTETWVEDVDCNLLVWDRILHWTSVKIILKNWFSYKCSYLSSSNCLISYIKKLASWKGFGISFFKYGSFIMSYQHHSHVHKNFLCIFLCIR